MSTDFLDCFSRRSGIAMTGKSPKNTKDRHTLRMADMYVFCSREKEGFSGVSFRVVVLFEYGGALRVFLAEFF